jgi:hypothetical protein
MGNAALWVSSKTKLPKAQNIELKNGRLLLRKRQIAAPICRMYKLSNWKMVDFW